MKKFLILLFMLWVSVLFAGEGQWFDGYGEEIADDTRTLVEVKQNALAKARRMAIERAVGVMVQGDTLLKDFVIQADFTAALSTGHIIEEKILRWDASIIKENDYSAPAVLYKVFIKANVGMEKGTPDPAFKIKASLNRRVFKEQDSVIVKVKSTKDCYLNIFIVTEKNDVFLILPNKYRKNTFVKKGEEFVYPTENDIARGMTLKAGLIQGTNKAKEFFRVIATKNPVDFPPDMFKEGIGLNVFGSQSGSLGDLLKELVAIPANERADTYIAYEIVR